ncbi:hypothetical protein MLD52_07660 [Puniceicoccaceae bacterium K14]|nr:hypothetical protein [Puniceicoccaceae bacterium K14]
MIKRYAKILGSSKVTIACFFAAAILLLLMSIAQIENGPKGAAEEFAYNTFLYWSPNGVDLTIPYFPGGYLIAAVLVINLLCAIFFKIKRNGLSIGLCLIYLSVIILIVGDFFSHRNRYSSTINLRQGKQVEYTESSDKFELAIKDVNDAEKDRVYAIHDIMLRRLQTIRHPDLPFYVSINQYAPNSLIEEQSQGNSDISLFANQGFGKGVSINPIREATQSNESNKPSALITLFNDEGAIGSWLVRSNWDEQTFNYKGRLYSLELRPKRYYHSFNLELVDQQVPFAGSTDKTRSASLILSNGSTTQSVLLKPEQPYFYEGLSFHIGNQEIDTLKISVIRNPAKALLYWALAIGSCGCILYLGSHIINRFKTKT